MGIAVKQASKLQCGIELTRGTAVAATRRLIGAGTVTYKTEDEPLENLLTGTLARTAVAPVRTRNGFELKYGPTPLSFEELLFGLMSGLKGGVSPTGMGDDQLWTFTKPNAADPAPDTFTLEWVESDLTDPYGAQAAYCFATEIEISGSLTSGGSVPSMTITVVGQKPTLGATPTGSIAVPTLQFVGDGAWQLFLDDLWADLGDTGILGQVYGFNWKLSGFIFPQYYIDGRLTQDFSTYSFKQGMVDFSVDIAIDPSSGSLARAEMDNKETDPQPLRFARMLLTGPDLGGSEYSLALDGAYYHAADSMTDRGSDRDGNLVTKLHLMSAYDPTSSNDIQVLLVNALTDFPSE